MEEEADVFTCKPTNNMVVVDGVNNTPSCFLFLSALSLSIALMRQGSAEDEGKEGVWRWQKRQRGGGRWPTLTMVKGKIVFLFFG